MSTVGSIVGSRPRSAISGRRRSRVERICYLIGALLALAGLAHLGAAMAFPRPWLGPLSWRKPVTFGLSFGTVLASVTWVTTWLRMRPGTRAVLLGVFALDSVVEVTGVSIQAWRDVPSHLNTVGALNATIAYALAVGGGVLVAVLGTFAVIALRGRLEAPPAMRLAVRAGFGLLLVGLATGAAMVVRGEQLITAGHRQLAYEHAGYLKWPHAVTLHAVLVLPALAWWLARSGRSEQQQYRLVAVATGVYVVAAVVAVAAGVTATYLT